MKDLYKSFMLPANDVEGSKVVVKSSEDCALASPSQVTSPNEKSLLSSCLEIRDPTGGAGTPDPTLRSMNELSELLGALESPSNSRAASSQSPRYIEGSHGGIQPPSADNMRAISGDANGITQDRAVAGYDPMYRTRRSPPGGGPSRNYRSTSPGFGRPYGPPNPGPYGYNGRPRSRSPSPVTYEYNGNRIERASSRKELVRRIQMGSARKQPSHQHENSSMQRGSFFGLYSKVSEFLTNCTPFLVLSVVHFLVCLGQVSW
jgi:hypothetical protein